MINFSSQVLTIVTKVYIATYNEIKRSDFMGDNLNKQILSTLGSLDKNKIEQISKMVQNMSSEDLNNIAKMLGVNKKNNG